MDNRDRWTRRGALKMMGAVALASVPASRLVLPASAGRSWCRSDPGLLIGGQVTHIYLHSYQEMLLLATGPIELNIKVPPGMHNDATLLFMDNGFGHSYTLKIEPESELKDSSKGIDIVVAALAPASDSSLEVHVEVIPVTLGKAPTIAKGYANEWIFAKGKL